VVRNKQLASISKKFSWSSEKAQLILYLIGFGIIGGLAILFSHAVTSSSSVEPETGTQSGNVVVKTTDATASGGKSVVLGVCPAGQTGTPPNCSTASATTLPPGSALPDGATCRTRVVAAAEIRPQNSVQNATAGHNKNLSGTFKARVDGNFTGTTDEIIQWVACKWGIDVNIVRAQAAKESYWTQANKGDWTTTASSCPPAHPLGADGLAGQCPESYGMLQVRWNYFGPPAGFDSWPEAETSTAYNADMAYSSWRDCYEGNYGWLNTVEHTGTYAAGDAMGCVGVWFAGRWKTTEANTYTQAVQDYYNQKIWLEPGFISYRG